MIHPYLRPSAARDSKNPMVAVRCCIDDLLLTAALVVASATLLINSAPRWPRGRDGGERPACEAHTTLPEQRARHQHACVVGRRCWEMETTSLTPRPFRRSSFKPTSACPTYEYPFFLELRLYYSNSQSIESHSLTSDVSRKKYKNCIFDPTDDKKGSYSQSSRKNNRSDTGFFDPRIRLHKKWPKAYTKPPKRRTKWMTLILVVNIP